MIGRILSTAALAVVLSGTTASANHDQGQGSSQDHLHRRNGPVPVSALSSGAMLVLGVAGAWFAFRRRR